MLAALIAALIIIESGGDVNVRDGDYGKAVGVLQIHPEVVQDVNRIYHTRYTHEGMREPVQAKQVCVLYLQFYGRQYQKETGLAPTPEILSRIWNGGPHGWKKASTLPYWEKVRALLDPKMEKTGVAG